MVNLVKHHEMIFRFFESGGYLSAQLQNMNYTTMLCHHIRAAHAWTQTPDLHGTVSLVLFTLNDPN